MVFPRFFAEKAGMASNFQQQQKGKMTYLDQQIRFRLVETQ